MNKMKEQPDDLTQTTGYPFTWGELKELLLAALKEKGVEIPSGEAGIAPNALRTLEHTASGYASCGNHNTKSGDEVITLTVEETFKITSTEKVED